MTPEQREEIRELAKTRKEPHHIICVPASQLLSLIEERDKLEACIAELEDIAWANNVSVQSPSAPPVDREETQG